MASRLSSSLAAGDAVATVPQRRSSSATATRCAATTALASSLRRGSPNRHRRRNKRQVIAAAAHARSGGEHRVGGGRSSLSMPTPPTSATRDCASSRSPSGDIQPSAAPITTPTRRRCCGWPIVFTANGRPPGWSAFRRSASTSASRFRRRRCRMTKPLPCSASGHGGQRRYRDDRDRPQPCSRKRSSTTSSRAIPSEHGRRAGVLEELQQRHPLQYLPAETQASSRARWALRIRRSSASSLSTLSIASRRAAHGRRLPRHRATRGSEGAARLAEGLRRTIPSGRRGDGRGLVHDADCRLTIRTVACFGQCALAPVAAIDEDHSRARHRHQAAQARRRD